ncbi:MAG: carbohydrate ABC transporter permease [Bacillota bacterium]|nr:MAG: ABC transporter permease [Bacillota bacterium]
MPIRTVKNPPSAGRKERSGSPARLWWGLLYAVLILYAVITFLPFVWAVSTSLKTLQEVSHRPTALIPDQPTLEAYRLIFSRTDLFLRWFFNSAVVTATVVILGLLFNSMAGYALARIPFFGQRFWFWFVLASLMVPGQVLIVPKYLIIRDLGGVNTYWGLFLPSLVNATWVFMMRQFFLNFPRELEEAAELDGLNRLQTFFRIVLPLAKPALAAQAMFLFIGSWNEFMWPLVIATEQTMYTLPVGLTAFRSEYYTFWNVVMAASMLFTLPSLILFISFRRYFMEGITLGGLKE